MQKKIVVNIKLRLLKKHRFQQKQNHLTIWCLMQHAQEIIRERF